MLAVVIITLTSVLTTEMLVLLYLDWSACCRISWLTLPNNAGFDVRWLCWLKCWPMQVLLNVDWSADRRSVELPRDEVCCYCLVMIHDYFRSASGRKPSYYLIMISLLLLTRDETGLLFQQYEITGKIQNARVACPRLRLAETLDSNLRLGSR